MTVVVCFSLYSGSFVQHQINDFKLVAFKSQLFPLYYNRDFTSAPFF